MSEYCNINTELNFFFVLNIIDKWNFFMTKYIRLNVVARKLNILRSTSLSCWCVQPLLISASPTTQALNSSGMWDKDPLALFESQWFTEESGRKEEEAASFPTFLPLSGILVLCLLSYPFTYSLIFSALKSSHMTPCDSPVPERWFSFALVVVKGESPSLLQTQHLQDTAIESVQFGVEELDWPAQSPELNRIRHLWGWTGTSTVPVLYS